MVNVKSKYTYAPSMRLFQIEAAAQRDDVTIYYAMNSCWWAFAPFGTNKNRLPCGPRGEVLMMTDDAAGFIANARSNPDHYGKHGLDAFEAAFDGNVRLDNVYHSFYPWSFRSWDAYNRLIDDGENFVAGDDE